jgi:hypothetical protein
MITISLKQKTKKNGHLVLDVPTSLKEKDVEILLVIQEQNDTIPETAGKEKMKKGKYDFSNLYGKLEWKGDALAEQKKLRSEWQ